MMKNRTKSRMLSVLLICVLLSAICPKPALAATSGNWIDYTTEPEMSDVNTYVIDSAEDLAWLSNQVSLGQSFDGYTIEVTAPLDLSDHYWTPIGNASSCFAGTFKGNGNKISGLTIGTAESPETDSQFIGLFGNTNGGEINGIELEDVKLFLSYIAYDGGIGAIAARSSGTKINNVSVRTAEIRSTLYSGSAINYDIGGIVGMASGMEIKNATVENVIISSPGNGSNFGGIAGKVDGTSVLDNCHATGFLEGANGSSLGGIVGLMRDFSNRASVVKNCYSACILKGYTTLGGFAGMLDGASVINCYSTGGIICVNADNSMTGGFVGKSEQSTYQNCFSRCDVIGISKYVGGFAAYTYQCTYSNNYAAARVVGSDKVGGFFGSQWSNTISNCYASYAYSMNGTGDGNVTGVTMIYDGYLKISDFADELNSNADTIIDAVVWALVPGENGGYPRFAGIGSFDASYAPIILNVTVSGSAKEYEKLTVNYDYFDLNSIAESGTTYQWYRADDSNGTGAEAIAGANARTYTMTAADVGHYICVDVTPSNGTASATTVKTGYVGAVTACPFTEGDGTPDNAFIIKSYDDLMHVSDYPGSCFRIDENVEITEEITSPICSDINPFTGNFNGNRKTLNVNISESTESYVGLFGYLYTGVISNLTVTGSISGTSSGTLYIGGIAGYGEGKIADCESEATITAEGGAVYAGGLVGYNYGSELYDNTASGSISGTSTGALYIGGITGYNSGEMTGNSSDATVFATGSTVYAGGLVGYNKNLLAFEHNTAGGSVSGISTGTQHVGGLVGYNTREITDCTSDSVVTAIGGTVYAGGFAGYNSVDGEIYRIEVMGTVSGTSTGTQYIGGLAGYSEGKIADSASDATVTANGGMVNAGGLVGCNLSKSQNANDRPLTSKAEIGSCSASGGVSAYDIESGSSIGGLVGANTATYIRQISPSFYSVTNSYATGDVTVDVSPAKGSDEHYAYVGGLVGYNMVTSIRDCYATGEVIGSNLCDAGGLVGYSRSMSIIERCFASGDVSVENCGDISKNTCLGGLIGYLSSGTLTCAYATGDVWATNIEADGFEYFGGLLGYLEKNTATVNRAYATGAVTGNIPSGKGGTGGLVGKYKDGTFTDAYWNSINNAKSNGNTDTAYGTGLPTILMTGSTALDTGNMSGLGTADFVIKANASGDGTIYYPQLKVFAESTDPATQAASLSSVTSVSDWSLVTVTVSGGGTVSATGGTDLGSGTYGVTNGTEVTLSAEADTGYSFESWYEGSTMVSSLADYTFTVNEDIALNAKFLSSDASLSDLTVDNITVSGFAADVYSYNVEVPFDTLPGSPAVTVGATANEVNASICINQAVTLPGIATVEVTAEDGTTKQTYTINFTMQNRAPARKEGVDATATASVVVNMTYALDLGTIFEDADGDELTYTVAINGADPIAALAEHSFTPTVSGVTTLVFRANDGTDNSADTYTVMLTAIAPPTITTESLPDGTVGTAYSQALAATGDTPITWSKDSGDLPDGLTLSAEGIISGTPTTGGTFNFTVKAENMAGSDTKELSIKISVAPTITTDTLPDGTVGTAYSQSLAATGDSPITWSIDSGDLPDGLSLSTEGVISGTPTTGGSFNFTVKAENMAGSDTKELSIKVSVAPTITTDTLPDGTVGTAYSQSLAATGDSPITWSIDSGDLPDGLSLSTEGVISGTPTTGGTFNFTVKAENMAGSDTKELSIKISVAPTITTDTLPDGTVGTAYSQALAATGDSPITWSIESGVLPNGLTLSAGGTISGTPTTGGTFNFTVKAENAVGSDTRTISIIINPAPPVNNPPVRKAGIDATTIASVVVNTAYTLDLSTIFEDMDVSDTLTYKVSVNDAAATEAEANYSYTPTEVGITTLVFSANDGMTDSTDIYTVTLTANAQTYSLTIIAGTGGTITTGTDGNYTKDTVITIAASPSTNYSFNRWTSTGGGSFADAYSASTTFTMPAGDAIITAEFTYKGGDGTGGNAPYIPQPVEGAKVETPEIEVEVSENKVTAIVAVTAIDNNSGKSTVAVTQTQVSEAISKALEEANKQGSGVTAAVEIKVEAPADAKTVETCIPKEAVELAADGRIETFTVSTPVAAISFDADALSAIAGEAAEDITISASKVETASLPAATQQLVGDRPVFNFSVTSGDKTISQFGSSVSVTMPYTPKDGEDVDAIVIYYINAEGLLETVSNCTYDPATGTVSLKTNHFSQYVIGYNKVSFKDVPEDAWYSKPVGFIAARGITKGTGDNNFSPQAKLTRAECLVMIMRTYGIEPDINPKDNFADAGNTYYTGYLATAKRLGISKGIGNNLYAPDREITRQEMFVLLYNVLKEIGELPWGNSGKQLSEFSDAEQTADWAKEAVTLFVETGVITGYGGRLFAEDTTTRAEMSKVLYNLLTR